MDRSDLKGLTMEELNSLINAATAERYERREKKRTDAINAVITAVENLCEAGFGDECVAADDVGSIRTDCYIDFNDLLDALRDRYVQKLAS